jgi:hypothetical protein
MRLNDNFTFNRESMLKILKILKERLQKIELD